MVEKKVAAEPTYDDAVSYLISVKEAFHVDPAKFKEFLKLLDDMEARRVDQASFFARVRELIKDHPKLLSGLRFFLPDQANIEIECDDADALLNKNKVNLNMVVKKVAAKPTVDDVSSYVTAVQETFHGEPAKCKDILDLFCDLAAKRVDQASFVARAEQLFRDHPNLLAGASVFFPDQANIFQIIPPEPEQPTELPDNIEIENKDADHLLNMIKTRFQRIDTHVPDSYAKLMEDYKQGKKSKTEVKEEVTNMTDSTSTRDS